MKDKPEIYVSTDVEADGPIPGPNSMLSFGSAAYLADKTLTIKKNMPRRWFDPLPHTHRALDDAIEQRALFCNMMKEGSRRASTE